MMTKYIVHYGVMRTLGVFSYADTPLRHGSRVIVQTPRGQEVGTTRCEAGTDTIAKLSKGFVENVIIRPMSENDENVYQKLQRKEQEHLEQCKRIIQEMKLNMELLRVEHVFGGERIVCYFTAPARVDFRELVKVLTAEFQKRIEMRQVNTREKIRLISCFGDCGRELCCCSFLRDLPIVTIKMAKVQRVALDPAKISGHCGRLKCCLRYEYDCYLKKKPETSAK